MKLVLLAVPLLLAGCTEASTPASSPAPRAPSASPADSPRPAVPGDVDGDGTVDEVGVSATTVTVSLSSGGRVVAPVVGSDVPQPAVSGLFDVDDDGRAEVFVETARGASTAFVQMFRYDGKALYEVTYDGGHQRFGIGGSVTHGEGFSCPGDGRLLVHRAETFNGTAYTVRTRVYRLVEAVLRLEGETTVTAPSMEDPRVGAAYQVDCGSVGEGGT